MSRYNPCFLQHLCRVVPLHTLTQLSIGGEARASQSPDLVIHSKVLVRKEPQVVSVSLGLAGGHEGLQTVCLMLDDVVVVTDTLFLYDIRSLLWTAAGAEYHKYG